MSAIAFLWQFKCTNRWVCSMIAGKMYRTWWLRPVCFYLSNSVINSIISCDLPSIPNQFYGNSGPHRKYMLDSMKVQETDTMDYIMKLFNDQWWIKLSMMLQVPGIFHGYSLTNKATKEGCQSGFLGWNNTPLMQILRMTINTQSLLILVRMRSMKLKHRWK